MKMHYLKEELIKRLQKDVSVLEFIQKGSLDGIWILNLENMEDEWMSTRFWETLGYDPKSKAHKVSEWEKVIFEEDKMMAYKELKKHLDNPEYPYDIVVRYLHQTGKTTWIRCRGIAIFNDNGTPIRMVGSHIDITNIKRIDDDFTKLKEEYETVFNGTQDAMFLIEVLKEDGFRFIRTNQSHQERTGITLDMIAGKTPQELMGKEAGDIVSKNYQSCVDQKRTIRYEEVLDLPGGKRTWYTVLSPIIKQGRVINIVGSARDITERKKLEQELIKKINYDTLTNLATRDYFYKKIQEAIQDADKRRCHFSLLYIDLNSFKSINDNFGHYMGDEVLKEVARRIKSVLAKNDFAARIGGDEFAVILCMDHKKYNEDYSEIIINKLKRIISKPMEINNATHHISAAIGIANYPQNGLNYETLIRFADKSMYTQKKDKR